MKDVNWTLVAEFPAQASLVIACRQFDYLKIRYDLRRASGLQQLWIADPEQIDQAVEVLQMAVQAQAPSEPGQKQTLFNNFERFPVVCITLILGILGALIAGFQFGWVHWLTFQEFVIVGDQIGFRSAEESFDKGQYWRLLTPAFLHFGIFHVAFNSLWLWELGRRVELLRGSTQSFVMLLLMAVGANIAQYWWSGPSLFGGLSGVVYGLLGYLWIRHKIEPQPLTQLPKGIVGFMLAWLVICMTGAVDALMAGSVANAAHAGGLLIGMALALPRTGKGKTSNS